MPCVSIVTTAPNVVASRIHNRMPAVLEERHFDLWLGEAPDILPPAELRPLFDALTEVDPPEPSQVLPRAQPLAGR